MANTRIADALTSITGSWKAASSSGEVELREARTSLAAAVASGIDPQALRAGPAPVLTPGDGSDGGAAEAIATIADGVGTPSDLTVVPRVRDDVSLDLSNAADAILATPPSKTLGPFVDELGASHFVDLFPVAKKIAIESATHGVLGEIVATAAPPAALGAGSLWISVAALGVNVPGAVGLAFTSATSHVQGTLQPAAGKLVIPAGATLTLDLTLVQLPAPPAGPGSGADATHMLLGTPGHATIVFTANGVSVSAFDAASATVYGTAFTVQRNGQAPRHVQVGSNLLVFPGHVSIPQFTVATCLSPDVVLAGSAAVAQEVGGWALSIDARALPQLGDAVGAGGLYLELGPGLSGKFGALRAPLAFAATRMVLGVGAIALGGTVRGEGTQRYALWDAAPAKDGVVPPSSRFRSEIVLRTRRGAEFIILIQPDEATAIVQAGLHANVDRPLGADGRRLPIDFDLVLLAVASGASGKRVVVVGNAPNAQVRVGTIALENAVVRCGPAREILLNAKVDGARLTGALTLGFDLTGFVPTLPDPYATTFDLAQQNRVPATSLIATVNWTTTPQLSLKLANPVAATPASAEASRLVGGLTLLDVSTRADQFGVQLFARSQPLSIDGIAVAAPQQSVAVYALPGISWEPVVDDRTDDWYDAFTPDDGGPTRLVAKTVTLVRMEPLVALPQLRAAAATADLAGSFTLPFGLTANLVVDATAAPGNARPTLALIASTFASGFTAGLQLAIHAGSAAPPGAPPGSSRALPGNTGTGAGVPLVVPTSNYGAEILGADERVGGVPDLLSAAQFFDQQFAAGQKYPEIPASRIDLSGYGTSMVSDWAEPSLAFVGVVRARFDVYVGRTAYELVQLQSVIAPWSIRITRTIVFERFDSGMIVRHDTGWKATGDGRFELLHPDQLLGGAYDRLTRVQNIVPAPGAPVSFTSPDVDEPNKPPGTRRTIAFAPVTFDADLLLASGVSGVVNGRPGGALAATRALGYVQETVGAAASAAEVVELLQKLDAAGITVDGQAGAIVNVGAAASAADPKFTLNVSSFSAGVTSANVSGRSYPGVAVALHGTPRLPRDGAWSIGRRERTALAPTAVDPLVPIPLVRARSGATAQWRMLDPVDALSVASPKNLYGLLQSAGTSKTFYEHLIVDDTGQQLGIDPTHAPNLADVGALLGATDIFPNLADVLKIPAAAGDALKLAGDGFEKTFSWDITDPDRTIFELGVIKLVLAYHGPDTSNPPVDKPAHATLTLKASGSPRLQLELERLTFAAYVNGISSDPIIQIHGGFSASDGGKPGFQNIQVEYGSALSFVKEIISGLSELVKSLGGDVDLDVGFSGNRLTVHQGFVLPTIPLGLGEVRDVGIDLGLAITIPKSASFNVGIGGGASSDGGALRPKPFTWIVDPLTGNGALALGVVDGDLAVYIEAGIGAALAIDVVVASGSASIILQLAISTDQKPFVITVTLIGHAEVDVLGGLASASLTLTAGIALHPDFPPASALPNAVDFTAMVAVAIHLSICWIISVDFDGSWQFSQTVPLHLP